MATLNEIQTAAGEIAAEIRVQRAKRGDDPGFHSAEADHVETLAKMVADLAQHLASREAP